MINRGHNFVSFCHAVGRCATRRNRNGEAASVALAREFCGVRSKFLANRRQGPIQLKGVEIFYGVNARIWANPVSCSHITFFVGCSLLPPNRKSTGIRTIRTTPTLRGANQSSRTETHTPNPLLPLNLHYSIRNVHPLKVCSTTQRRSSRVLLESTGRLPDLRVPEAKRGACGFSAFPKVPRPAWKQSKTRGGPPATEETMRGSIGPDYT